MLSIAQQTAPIPAPPGYPPFPGDGYILTNDQTKPAESEKPKFGKSNLVGPPPAFLREPPPLEPAPPRPLIASRPNVDEPAAASPLDPDGQERRFQRGILIHRMLQTLPDLPPAARGPAAARFLCQPAHDLSPDLQERLAAETLNVLTHPNFAALWGPGSRAEVPIIGLVDGFAFSGRVDRLVVSETEVMVVDYKTNRPPPVSPDLVADSYRDQLRAYRLALEAIYPERRVRTVLLWTDGPSIMEIDTASIE